MNKSAVFAGAVIVVAAAYAGSAWYVGMEAEKTIRAAVEQANERMAQSWGPDSGTVRATLAIEDYQRGLFSSNARYSLLVQDDDERIELAMQDAMQHGPFPWGLIKQGSFEPLLAYSQSQLVDTESVKRWFDAARGTMPLQADTRIGFGGQGKTVWELAPLEWAADGDQFSFSGGHITINFSNDLRDSDGTAHFDSLVVGGGPDGENVSLKGMRLESQARTAADESIRVDTSLQVAAVEVDTITSERVVLEETAVTWNSTQQGAVLDAAARYEIKRILVGGQNIGNVVVGGKADRLDLEAFSALVSEYDAIAHEHGAEEGEDFDPTVEDQERMLARLVPVLATRPEIALDPLVWRNEKGESSLALSVALQPLAEEDAHLQEDILLTALRELRLDIALSRSMLMQLVTSTAGNDGESAQLEMLAAFMYDTYVGQLEEAGLVRRDGDRDMATLVYSDGMVDINGQAISLPEFLMFLGLFGL